MFDGFLMGFPSIWPVLAWFSMVSKGLEGWGEVVSHRFGAEERRFGAHDGLGGAIGWSGFGATSGRGGAGAVEPGGRDVGGPALQDLKGFRGLLKIFRVVFRAFGAHPNEFFVWDGSGFLEASLGILPEATLLREHSRNQLRFHLEFGLTARCQTLCGREKRAAFGCCQAVAPRSEQRQSRLRAPWVQVVSSVVSAAVCSSDR